jgi:hypothetical protein
VTVLDSEFELLKPSDYGRRTAAVVAGTVTVREDVGHAEDRLRVIPATLMNKVVDACFSEPVLMPEMDVFKLVAFGERPPHVLSLDRRPAHTLTID